MCVKHTQYFHEFFENLKSTDIILKGSIQTLTFAKLEQLGQMFYH